MSYRNATIPAEHIVETIVFDFERGGVMVQEAVDYATGRTSKGDHTHIVYPSNLGGLSTICGLDQHGRVRHSIWTTQPGRITCEKCNGEKPRSKRANVEYMKNRAAKYAAAR